MLDDAMRQLAAQLKDTSSLLFFARGNNYATALEAALKVGTCLEGRHLGLSTLWGLQEGRVWKARSLQLLWLLCPWVGQRGGTDPPYQSASPTPPVLPPLRCCRPRRWR